MNFVESKEEFHRAGRYEVHGVKCTPGEPGSFPGGLL